MKKEHKDMLPEYKPIKTRGAMYVLSPFIFYVIGVIIVELLLSLAFFLFSLAASSLGNSLLLSVDAFLYRNEEMLIPAISGIIKIPHFLKDFYREDWEYRVEKEKGLAGEYVFNMHEAGLWKGKKGILKSFQEAGRPLVIVLLAVSACVFFNLAVNRVMNYLHVAYSGMAYITDVGGVGGPGSAVHVTGGDTIKGITNLWVVIFGTVIVAPVVEELVFRGVIFRRMRDDHGFLISAVVGSATFGLIHFNLVQGIFGFFMGLVFSFIYERTHRLTAPIIAHASANVLSVLMLLPATKGVFELLGSNAAYVVLIFCVSGILCLVFLAVLRRRTQTVEYVPYSHVAGMEEGEEAT